MADDRSIVVVLAHPDDESFGMGGALAKYAAQGTAVTLICATRGEAGVPGLGPEQAARVRERELLEAARCLGLAEVRFLDCRDGELDRADQDTLVARLSAALRELRPQAVITFGPDGISGHADHIAISRLTTRAFDQTGLSAALYYLAPSDATQQGCGVAPSRQGAGGPVAAIDVADHLVTKVKAMQCHTSQHPPYPGKPEEEASRLACHEYFTLVRPTSWTTDVTDLFAPLEGIQPGSH